MHLYFILFILLHHDSFPYSVSMYQSVIITVYSCPASIQSKYYKTETNIKNYCIIKNIKVKIRKEHIYEMGSHLNLNNKSIKYTIMKSPCPGQYLLALWCKHVRCQFAYFIGDRKKMCWLSKGDKT